MSTENLGLVVSKPKNIEFGEYTIGLPENLKVKVESKSDDIVGIEVTFDIHSSEDIEGSVDIQNRVIGSQLDDEIKNEVKGFLGVKSISKDKYEVETKRLPKMTLRLIPAEEDEDEDKSNKENSFMVAPTIESNDTMIRIKMTCPIAGQISGNFVSTSKPGLKVRVLQKFLGDYIISGLLPDTFKVYVTKNTPYEKLNACIEFSLENSQINKSSKENTEWEDLLMQERIAYLFLKNEGDNDFLDTNPNDKTFPRLKIDFSFNMFDGRLNGVAKAPGNASATFSI